MRAEKWLRLLVLITGMRGMYAGEDLVEQKPDGGQVVIVENLNVNSVCERITGFEEAVSKGAFEVVKRNSDRK